MELTVHGKQMDVGDALRSYVESKIEDINSKYFNRTVFASVTFSREGHGHQQTKVHIVMNVGGNITVNADSMAFDPHAAFDEAAEKAAKQMRRQKRRVRDDHGRTKPELAEPDSDFEDEEVA